ncbi:vacuolar protease A precursor, putative [Perkinsus marinus ATCC 50983]|uniref:Vacuolar protease A, putative n=1 Tax=Perkinsus marinus (strain ATCC 50983 / TXsc) TaxID=423536 RepID=C5K8J4_PERM5|nr:vacuolar protease A precursor, putative [Perkinsus marinus ATCC 50983]EER19201.1 vacuolar protease A precursor, putative [Perkinsus marinus ATCC 50983]|eukprot:XP_002787405.1 vacuolar protease A precursor, putative [Perkinsus marinus ATCC 50983]
MSLFHFSLVCIGVLLGNFCGGKVIRLKISVQQTKRSAPWRFIVAPLKVDTQDLYAIVDTGSPYTQLIWKTWYERLPGGRCDELFYKCYDCKPKSYELNAAKKISFIDKSSLTIFPFSGHFHFNDATVEDIDFGVVKGASHSAWAAVGLGPQDTNPPFPRFVDQLLSSEIVDSPVFAVYLSSGNSPSGELIIGGEDASKYDGPLEYIGTADKQQHTGELQAFAVGTKWQDEPGPVIFDTGSSLISIPKRLREEVIVLLSTAGKKKVEVMEKDDVFGVDCKDVSFLPSMRFTVRGIPDKADVTLAISPGAYIVSPEPDVCILAIHFGEGWILGLPAFVGHYYSFDWAGAKIGVAKLKE